MVAHADPATNAINNMFPDYVIEVAQGLLRTSYLHNTKKARINIFLLLACSFLCTTLRSMFLLSMEQFLFP